ncbi:MAG: methyltransferase domain-containing protein [Candidatus Hydrothermarchaeota archaeon]
MKYLVLLSGEHPKLPQAEVKATLEALSVRYTEIDKADQVFVFEALDCPDLSNRLAYAHFYGQLEFVCDQEKMEILRRAGEVSCEGSFSVRIKRVRGSGLGFKSPDLEKEIASRIISKESHVDLENPKNPFVLILSSDRAFFCRVIKNIDRSQYEKRKPQVRPYFRPGTILPRTARCLVNLSRARTNESFLDPFCGAGGILIEAGLVGCRVYGLDLDERVITGVKKNLDFYGIKRYVVEIGDARDIPFEDIRAIATDPPYGISASTMGLTLENLYLESLREMERVLDKGSYIAISLPYEKVDTKDIISKTGLTEVEYYLDRVHKSLTRRITVLRS